MTVFKNRTDLQTLREAGRVAGLVCDELIKAAQPGVSTMELEQLANKLLQMNRSTAPFKQFQDFNHAICVSLNAEIVNGPPSRQRFLTDGDLVSIAVGSCIKGLHGKAARTAYLGEPSPDIQRLLQGTREAIYAVERASQHTQSLRELIEHIPEVAAAYSLSVVEETGGAGIGRQLHEMPVVPNDPSALKADIAIVPGMALALMPMMTLGPSGKFIIHEDGWTQITEDGDLSAHFADTLLMTEEGFTNLTRLD